MAHILELALVATACRRRRREGCQHAPPAEACCNPPTITLRQALPLQLSALGIHWLPPNHPLFRLWLVQSIPTPSPFASLSTLVNQSFLASEALNGTSTVKPMNIAAGAARTKLR